MAKKNVSRILSGAALVICIVLFCTLNLIAQTYKAAKITYTISGSVGLSGVAMNGLPGKVVTDDNGYYTATVDYSWSGTVTPTMEGYTFEPANRIYTKVTADLPNQDYTATMITFTISGSTGMGGVVMSGLPGNPVTNANGLYTATVDYGFSGTVMPTKEGYTFKPTNRIYTNVSADRTNHDYTAALITFTISGTTGMDGIVMNGLPGNPVTGRGGLYSATVNYGFSATVTPTKQGYAFDPPERRYTDVTSGQANQNYTATLLSFAIAGTITDGQIPVEAVLVSAGNAGSSITNAQGQYSITVDYGFSGTVTPSKEGYAFAALNRVYANVTDDQDNQDYVATLLTFTISGSAGKGGIVMSGLPGDLLTNANGLYTTTVDYGFSGTVTPTKEGYTFKPPNRIYTNVNANLINQDYTPALITFTISGSAGMDSVIMKGLPGNPVTGRGGLYSTTVDYGFSAAVTPTKEGYTFDPPEREYTDVTSGQTNQNYTATLLTRTVPGTITCRNMPLEGVLVSAYNGGGSGTTNAEGKYELAVDYGFSGTITPTKEGYTFKPANRIYGRIVDEQANQDYTATLLTRTIYGTIAVDGKPIESVLVSASNGGGSDITNAQGRYSVTVDYGWSGTITPTKEGYIFDPASKTYTNVTEDQREDVGKLLQKAAAERRAAEEQRATAEQRAAAERRAAEEPVRRAAPEEPLVPELPEEPFVRELPEEAFVRELPEEAFAPRLPRGRRGLVSNVFIDTDLRQALQDIASQVGVIIIPDEAIAGVVTCELKDVPLEKALEIVLAGTGYVVKETPDYYLVSSPDPKAPVFPSISKTHVIKLSYLDAETAMKLLSPPLRNYVQADTKTNTLVITAPPPLLDRIVSDLKKIDRLPRHVLLDARIVAMESSDLLNLGVEWGWPKIRAGTFSDDTRQAVGATGAKWPWGIQIGYTTTAAFTDSLMLTLNLLAENGELNIVSSPQVLAQDGKVAEIKVTTEEYHMLVAPELTGYYYRRAELERIETGTVLNITPHIGGNNDITLDLAIELSDVTGRSKDDFPIVTRRTARNTVRVKDGGTVALAGLTEDRTVEDDRKVPGISRIPIIGRLFTSTRKRKSTREVAIFITARLVREAEPTVEFTEPSADQDLIESAGEEFKKILRENLSRQSKRSQ